METIPSTAPQNLGYHRIDEQDNNSAIVRSLRRFQFCNWCCFSILNIINTTLYVAGFALAVHLKERLETCYLMGMLGIALAYVVIECLWLGCTMANIREGYMFSKACSIVMIALFTSLIVILGIMEQIKMDQNFYIGITLLVIGMCFECIITMCSICFAEVYRNLQNQQRVAIIEDTESMLEPPSSYGNPNYPYPQGPPYPNQYYAPGMPPHVPGNPRVVPAEVHGGAVPIRTGIDGSQHMSVTSSVP